MEWCEETLLNGVDSLFNPLGDVGKHLVGPLDLSAGKGRDAGGVLSDGPNVRKRRLELALRLVDQTPYPTRDDAGGDKDNDVRDGDGECRERNHAKKHLSPGIHVVSRTRAS